MHMKEKITKVTNQMYGVLSSLEIANEHLKEKLGDSTILSIYGNEFPFTYFNKSYSEYELLKVEMAQGASESTYVSLISILEDYAYDVLRRYFALNPGAISEETAQTSFSVLYSYVDNHGPLLGIIESLVESKLRNKKTTDMFSLISSYCKSGVVNELSDDFRRIDEHSLIRNAIIHNDAYVTNDLIKCDVDKYKSFSQAIKVTHKDCIDLSHLIFKVVKRFEMRFLETVIGENDRKSLCKEIYVRTNNNKPGFYRKIVRNIFQLHLLAKHVNEYIKEVDEEAYDLSHEQYKGKLGWLLKKYADA